MLVLRLIICAFLFCGIFSCSKEHVIKPYAYVNLRVQGQDEDVRWESVKGTWNDSLGIVDIEATSYYFDRCKIHLENIVGVRTIRPVSLIQFYYTDGIDFQPHSISGVITITEVSDKVVRGTFNLYLDSNYNGSSGRTIAGDFGIVNKQY